MHTKVQREWAEGGGAEAGGSQEQEQRVRGEEWGGGQAERKRLVGTSDGWGVGLVGTSVQQGFVQGAARHASRRRQVDAEQASKWGRGAQK